MWDNFYETNSICGGLPAKWSLPLASLVAASVPGFEPLDAAEDGGGGMAK